MKTTKKIALVTGGSRGLGKNMVMELAKDGHHIVFTYNSKKEEAQNVVAEVEKFNVEAVTLQLNVGDTKSFPAFKASLLQVLKEKWDTANIDFLVNNAGINRASLISDTMEEDFDALVNTHFKGAYFLTQTLLNVIADGGRIVNISTGLARFVTPGYAAYSSMKAAIYNFTKYLAKELGPRKINANVVAPGIIETDFTREALENHPGAKEYLSTQIALGRVGVPDDIGGVVAFLCSERARWITAQCIEASGGMFL
ncbi:SDR family NAD(P)-dependent oxidoreductase [Chitinophaga sp. CF418]|uniref:SDR family NAD(P)-dependent oxidoreductase n=1 Tax=Chitinophaga sp. CF418 TaxID=1855287 RepID=UPI0009108F7E|nr:SDR family oxidoreductase [Chitinophaga sp. CF418]SHM76776.1 NAD(P)-dependent dehydrogenase, short-chain alcohol dehydrogenase family [Chitinophaga sp. CF418]